MQSDLQVTERSSDGGLFTGGNPVTHWSVRAYKQVDYEVRVEENLLSLGNRAILEDVAEGKHARRLVVVDSVVDELYGTRIRAYFEHHGVEYKLLVLADGESHKDMRQVLEVVKALDEFGVDRRREPIIAIGGGVLMDIVGCAAGMYRRGTPWIRIPTTLIGLVDAGVGVKTGVNNDGHKNRIGSYFSADRTLLDRSFLATLDERHIGNGLAEILKIALVKDRRLFVLLEQHGARLRSERLQAPAPGGADPAAEVVERAIHGMLEELQPNLWEKVLERVVDYGHSFSPVIEMHALPELLHGEAVAVDMALTTVIAEQRGLVTSDERRRIFSVMTGLGLSSWHELCTPKLLVPALRDTVRHRDGQQRLPLPVGIGSAVFVNDLTEDELERAAQSLADLHWGDVR
ncbi:sedoheptulose 7-phosphate cyclase [Streptomyces sp. AP-93]|uniref:sedoheptulose 7-phosphate cyclase n=1 Tax=Streptomyces sp. AP-93 TaxID=2929048 RepID=UPI001FAFCF58|nr:sedoheptulose 7-phosphate cyclase [Streptomyces sp. AP-93]MCJ0871919.1 sedoheptulose 7-phosphate cyclase [Streptomyces sp. AP-93]